MDRSDSRFTVDGGAGIHVTITLLGTLPAIASCQGLRVAEECRLQLAFNV
jgi:hypothetical protein